MILIENKICNPLYCQIDKKMNIFHQEAGEIPVRESGKISISFTHREFPTPVRESIQPEEDAVSCFRL